MSAALRSARAGRARGSRFLAACSIAALAWALLARILGPSDLWDQTQPKTIAYTTDMIVHGGWRLILPMERGELPATKPPLYNWLAAPAVMILGFHSELAHKLPSVIALCLTWLVVVRLGRSIDFDGNGDVGWVAGMIVPANYTMFKLGYLARPDMLLTLWLLLAWMCATAALIRFRRATCSVHVESMVSFPPPMRAGNVAARWATAGFWLFVALAGLTKGPPAIVALVYVPIAARVICGSWVAARCLRPALGLPLVMLGVGAWVYGVWRIDPVHLREQLWLAEFLGRVTGTGPLGTHNGETTWLMTLPHHLFYFAVRFGPWSLLSVAAVTVLAWRRWRRRRGRAARALHRTQRAWLLACFIYIAIVIIVFTFSTGKRADYIAAAFPPGALLASWWLLRMGPRMGERLPWLAPAAAAIALLAMTRENQAQRFAPSLDFGDHISHFATHVTRAIRQQPMPVIYYEIGQSHLETLVGPGLKEGKEAIWERIRRREGLWVLAGHAPDPSDDFSQLILTRRKTVCEAVVHSPQLPRAHGWPGQVTLYKLTPVSKPPKKPKPPRKAKPAALSSPSHS